MHHELEGKINIAFGFFIMTFTNDKEDALEHIETGLLRQIESKEDAAYAGLERACSDLRTLVEIYRRLRLSERGIQFIAHYTNAWEKWEIDGRKKEDIHPDKWEGQDEDHDTFAETWMKNRCRDDKFITFLKVLLLEHLSNFDNYEDMITVCEEIKQQNLDSTENMSFITLSQYKFLTGVALRHLKRYDEAKPEMEFVREYRFRKIRKIRKTVLLEEMRNDESLPQILRKFEVDAVFVFATQLLEVVKYLYEKTDTNEANKLLEEIETEFTSRLR